MRFVGVKTIIICFIRVILERLFKHQRFSDSLRVPQKLIFLQIPTSYLLSLTSYLLPLISYLNSARKDTNNQQIGKLTNYPYFCALKQTEECEQDQ